MWGALADDRSFTSEINASILAIRLRTFFAFMTTPTHVHSAVDFASTFDVRLPFAATGSSLAPSKSTFCGALPPRWFPL
jgi:hypothetical protein